MWYKGQNKLILFVEILFTCNFKGAIVTLNPLIGNWSTFVSCIIEKWPLVDNSNFTSPFWVNSISGHSVPMPTIDLCSMSHFVAS